MEKFPGHEEAKEKEIHQPSPEQSTELPKGEPFSPLKEKLLTGLQSLIVSVVVPTYKTLEPALNAVGFDTGRERVADQEKMTADYTFFEKLSDEAGDFFSDLIPKGIRKPVSGNARHGGKQPVYYSQLARENQEVTHHFQNARFRWQKEYREEKKKVLEGTLFGDRKPFEGKVKESEMMGMLVQERLRSMYQGGTVNLIHERVRNEIDKDHKHNEARADLVLQNVTTGEAVNLNSLLPIGWNFSPSSLRYVPEEGKKLEAINLKKLEEASLQKPHFAAAVTTIDGQVYEREILYGNLSEKGAVLSLLHEIAHAWQQEYLDKDSMGRSAFEDLYRDILGDLLVADLCKLKDKEEGHASSRVEGWIAELKAQGVEPYYDATRESLTTTTPVIEDGVINIKFGHNVFTKDYSTPVYYPVRSERLKKALDGYVADERDAWAHALKIMRFLRTKGIDVAPELTNLEEMRAKIHPCLESYQNELEDNIGAGVNKAFLRRRQSTNTPKS